MPQLDLCLVVPITTVSVAGNVSAGQIFTGSGVDSVIITGSLLGDATVRLDNSGSSEESADSIIGNISSGVVYGESGADTFNISGDARVLHLRWCQNDSVTIASSFLSSGLLEAGEGNDIFKVADVVSSTVKGETGNDFFSATGAISSGVLYGNAGTDTIEVVGAVSSSSIYGGSGNDSLTVGGAANTLTYEGGVGADSIYVSGAINKTTIYGDNSSTTEAGDDSISSAEPRLARTFMQIPVTIQFTCWQCICFPNSAEC